MRTFNTAGPRDPARHYMVPPIERLPEARRLVEQGDCFVLHAPRQSGKTTLLRALSQTLTAEGKLAALQFSGETGEPMGDDYEEAQRSVLSVLRRRARGVEERTGFEEVQTAGKGYAVTVLRG